MSFASETRERSRPVLPLAAMVDVLFLLLIFFMTASVFREAEAQLDIDLPEAATAADPGTAADRVTVNIDASNRVYLGERRVAFEALPGELARLAEEAGIREVVVRGDSGSDWGVGVRVTDLAKQAGLDASIAANRPAEELE